jgi:hypothetical protein
MTDPAMGESYFWRLRAKNDAGEWGQWGACWSFSTLPMPPEPPVLQSPECGAAIDAGQTSVGLDWTDVPGASRYQIEYGLDLDGGQASVIYSTPSELELDLSEFCECDVVEWRVRTEDGCEQLSPWSEDCDFTIGECGGEFIRGDTDVNGEVNISDPIHSLCYQFADCDAPSCLDAADCDDSGEINISDPIYNLSYQFAAGPPPPAPFPEMGRDPTDDDPLDCGSYPPSQPRGVPAGPAYADEADGVPRIELTFQGMAADNVALVEVSITTDHPLHGFEFTASYDPTALDYAGIVREGLAGEGFDFFSGSAGDGTGLLRVGVLPSIGLDAPMDPGTHALAQLRFQATGLPSSARSRIALVDAIFVYADMTEMRVQPESSVSVGRDSAADTEEMPAGMAFSAPVPFRPNSAVMFSLDQSSNVHVKIYDVHGRQIRTLIDENMAPGNHNVRWDGRTDGGASVATGIYYVRAALGEREMKKKILFAR